MATLSCPANSSTEMKMVYYIISRLKLGTWCPFKNDLALHRRRCRGGLRHQPPRCSLSWCRQLEIALFWLMVPPSVLNMVSMMWCDYVKNIDGYAFRTDCYGPGSSKICCRCFRHQVVYVVADVYEIYLLFLNDWNSLPHPLLCSTLIEIEIEIETSLCQVSVKSLSSLCLVSVKSLSSLC